MITLQKNHDPTLDRDKVIKLKGILDKSLKGKKVIFKGISEEDVREIRQMLIKEIKKQKEGEVKNECLK